MAEKNESYLGKVVTLRYPDYDSYGRLNGGYQLYEDCFIYEQGKLTNGHHCYSGVMHMNQTITSQLCIRTSILPDNIVEITGDAPMKKHIDFMMLGEGMRFLHNQNTVITIGSDPEVFAVNEKDIVIPAFEFCPPKSEIEEKAKQRIDTKECKPFWDGFQAEFLTETHRCLEGLVTDVGRGLLNSYRTLTAKFPTGRLVSDNLVEIPEAMLQMAAEEYVQFGCSPSKNAYKAKPLAIANGREVPIRAAGMHIHFGIGATPGKEELVKLLDASMGIASVAMFGKEEDPRRREMYGRAGEYREPAHGLEYRVLSSAVLQHPYRLHLMVDMGRFVMRLKIAGVLEQMGFEVPDENVVQSVINNVDIEGARALLEKNKHFWANFFQLGYGHVEKPWKWLMDGHRKVGDINKNWQFEDGCSSLGANTAIRNAQ